MKVKYIKSYGGYGAGERAVKSEKEGARLLKLGVCMLDTPAPVQSEKEAKPEEDKAMRPKRRRGTYETK